MYRDEFGLRLAQLREQKGVSARDMSLSLGQNHSYINNIENGRAMPAMNVFFYICEYLNVTPSEFFETESINPEKVNAIIKDLKKLDDKQLDTISALIKGLIK